MTISGAEAGVGPSRGGQIRVMTADDHPIFRDGLAALLAAYADLKLVAQAGDGRKAVELYREHRPDVTLMDLSMPTPIKLHSPTPNGRRLGPLP